MDKKILLVEDNFLTESSKEDKNWYIQGVFAQAEAFNKNKRIYPEYVLDREVELFTEQFIKTNRAAGELNHPDHSSINPDRVAIKIESIDKQGVDYIGRAKVLTTECGKTISALLEGGLVIGVSTRGSGTVTRLKEGRSRVNDDFGLVTIDAVMNPSAPKALVQAVYENEDLENLIHDEYLMEQFLEFLKMKKDVKNIPTRASREQAMIESVNKLMKTLLHT